MDIVLGKKEEAVRDDFYRHLRVQKRRTREPIIVAMVGLVGSGKTSVATALAKEIGATLISVDDLRVLLRKKKLSFDHTTTIVHAVVARLLERNASIVIDGDYNDAGKRELIKQLGKRSHARVVFVRAMCAPDVMFGRIMSGKYKNGASDFFGGADVEWKGPAKYRAPIVKMREMWRQTPKHFAWNSEAGGGQWVLKTLHFPLYAVIDTADERLWKLEVKKLGLKLLDAPMLTD